MKNNNNPLVSICCAAYNHEKYIEDALKGFLMQEVDFEYEILIHDDASTDKTANIIRKYEKLHPDKIFPIYQTENQYSQGRKYSDLNYERARGRYIAICEGDDYWIDKNKLSQQIQLMQKNPQFDLSFHLAKQINIETSKEEIIGQYLNKDGIVPIENIIAKSNNLIPYASCIITLQALNKVLEFKSTRPYLTVGDIYMQIIGSLRGEGALFLNNVMSIYRYMTPTSWTKDWKKSYKYQVHHSLTMTKSLKELNEITNYKYSLSFEKSTLKRVFQLLSIIYINDENEEELSELPFFAQKYFEALKDHLKTLLNNEEQYILYGSGSGAKFMLNIIGNKIDYIIDMDSSKEGTYFEGKKIYTLDKLNDNNSPKKVLISLIGRKDDLSSSFFSQLQKRAVYVDDILAEKELLREINFD